MRGARSHGHGERDVRSRGKVPCDLGCPERIDDNDLTRRGGAEWIAPLVLVSREFKDKLMSRTLDTGVGVSQRLGFGWGFVRRSGAVPHCYAQDNAAVK